MTSSHHRPASHNPWNQDKEKLTVVQSVAQNEYGRITDDVAGEHKFEYGKRSLSSNEFGEHGSNGLEMESYTSKEPRRRRNPRSQDNHKQTVVESVAQNEYDPITGDVAGELQFEYGNNPISSNEYGKHGSNGLEMESHTSKEPRPRRKVVSDPDRNKNGGSLSDLDDQTFNAGHKYMIDDVVQVPIGPTSTEFHGLSGKPLEVDVANDACNEGKFSTAPGFVDHRYVSLPLKYKTKQRPSLPEDSGYTTKEKSAAYSHKYNINECSFLNDNSDGEDLEKKNFSATIQLKKGSSTKITVQSGLTVERPQSMCASIDQAHEQVRSRGSLCSKPLPPLPQSEDDEMETLRVFSSDTGHGKNAQSSISNQAPVRKTLVTTHKLLQPIQAGEKMKSAVPSRQIQRRQNSAVVLSETHPALRGDPAAIQRSTPEKDELDRLPASLVARLDRDQSRSGPEMQARVREVKAAHVQAARVQPAPVQPTPVQPAPVQRARVRPSPRRPAPIGPAPVQPAPDPPGRALAVQFHAIRVQADQALAAQVEAAQVEADQALAAQVQEIQAQATQALATQVQAAQVQADQALTAQVQAIRRQALRAVADQVMTTRMQAAQVQVLTPNTSPTTGLSSSNTLVEPSNDRRLLGPAIETAASMNARLRREREAEKPRAIVTAVVAHLVKKNALYLFKTPAYRAVEEASASSVDSQTADTRPLPPGSGSNTRIIDIPTSPTPTTDSPQGVAFAQGAYTAYSKHSLIKIAERLGLEALKDGIEIRQVHEDEEAKDRETRQGGVDLEERAVTVGTEVSNASTGNKEKAPEAQETHLTKSKVRRTASSFLGKRGC